MSLLELSGVEKSFGAVQVLHGVDVVDVERTDVQDAGHEKSTPITSIMLV